MRKNNHEVFGLVVEDISARPHFLSFAENVQIFEQGVQKHFLKS